MPIETVVRGETGKVQKVKLLDPPNHVGCLLTEAIRDMLGFKAIEVELIEITSWKGTILDKYIVIRHT